MAHECELCYQPCYCDIDDTGGLPQPSDCPHWARHDSEDDADLPTFDDDDEPLAPST